jgi:hypothetical protein
VGQAAKHTAVAFARAAPIIVGVLALVSLATAILPPDAVVEALPLTGPLGPVLGAAAGSLAAGHPVTSYVLAGELTVAGASLATVTALIVSWVTVGLLHLPAEAAILGLRFALWRNLIGVVLAIAIGYLIGLSMPLLGS